MNVQLIFPKICQRLSLHNLLDNPLYGPQLTTLLTSIIQSGVTEESVLLEVNLIRKLRTGWQIDLRLGIIIRF